jgi:RNA polymerase sigma-70 factor (ECF subfamily)
VAEDLTGDVFLQMVQALHRYTDRGAPFAAWLFRIAHDRVIDYHRRQARRPTVPLFEALSDDEPGPETQAAHQADTHGLRAAMKVLTDEQRTVLQLRFLEGHSVELTARLMRKTPGAIKALQHRALSRLGRRLQP